MALREKSALNNDRYEGLANHNIVLHHYEREFYVSCPWGAFGRTVPLNTICFDRIPIQNYIQAIHCKPVFDTLREL